MRKYWAFYRLRFERTLFYRGSVIVFRLANILLLITLAAVWLAADSGGQIGGYTKSGLITYFIAGSFVNAFVFWFGGGTIREEIRNGEIATKALLKPVSYYWMKFFEEFSWHTVAPIFASISLIVVGFFLRDYIVIRMAVPEALMVILAMGLGAVLFFNISACWGLLTFWFEETQGLFAFVWGGIFLFGGQAIPISFFSPQLQQVIQLLPFRYVYSFPLEIFSDRLTTSQMLSGFLVQAVWIGLFGLLYRQLWKKGVTRYSAYGG